MRQWNNIKGNQSNRLEYKKHWDIDSSTCC